MSLNLLEIFRKRSSFFSSSEMVLDVKDLSFILIHIFSFPFKFLMSHVITRDEIDSLRIFYTNFYSFHQEWIYSFGSLERIVDWSSY